jgi:hypothetical protein
MAFFRRPLSDILTNTVAISVAFTSAIFAGYMILYGAQEDADILSQQQQIVIKDPIDRGEVAPRRWAEDKERIDSLATASMRDPSDRSVRKVIPTAKFPDDPLTNSYVLRAVFQGTALIEIRNELAAELWPVTEGSLVPGAGKVIAIEQRDDRWQVITTERTIAEDVR